MAVEALDIAQSIPGVEVAGFLVDVEGGPEELEGFPVYQLQQLDAIPADVRFACGIVSTRRRKLVEALSGRRFCSLVHPSAQISRRARLGDGCLVHPGVIVASNTVIADHVLINRGALVGHDNRIASFTTIGPGANLAGALDIGEGVYIGVGSVVRDHLTIGAGSIVAAGAVVVKPVPERSLVGGVPAQVLKSEVEAL